MIEFRINNNYWQLGIVDKEAINDNLGITYFSDYKILLSTQDNRKNMKSALIHELTHAFRWSYGFIISDQNKVGLSAMDLEEVIANVLEAFGRDIIELSDKLWIEVEEWLDRLEKEENE